MNAVEEIKKIFIRVLYKEMKYMKRSRYLIQKTRRYISWVLHDMPIKEKHS